MSTHPKSVAAPAPDVRRAKIVARNARLLGALVVLFYLGFLAWNLLRGAGGAL